MAFLAVALLAAAGAGAAGALPPGLEIRDSPRLGPADAPVTIVEFADFECVHCARGARALRQVLPAYRDQVRVVFKHFPLRHHRMAPLAHEAALAAGQQGKFWEMRRMILANPSRLTRDDLIEYAGVIGLDVPAFTAVIDDRRLRGRVIQDIREGRALNVSAVPTYFINGERVVGARTAEGFRDLIDGKLAAARGGSQ